MATNKNSNQPAPQSRAAASRDADEYGVPETGFIEAPTFDDGKHNFETGPGVPPSQYRMR